MEFEITFAEEFIALVNKYVQSKTIDILDKRYDILRNEIDNLAKDIREQEEFKITKLDTPISLSELSPDTSSQILMEIGDLEQLPAEFKVRISE